LIYNTVKEKLACPSVAESEGGKLSLPFRKPKPQKNPEKNTRLAEAFGEAQVGSQPAEATLQALLAGRKLILMNLRL